MKHQPCEYGTEVKGPLLGAWVVIALVLAANIGYYFISRDISIKPESSKQQTSQSIPQKQPNNYQK